MAPEPDHSQSEIFEKLKQYDQSHVLRYWNELSSTARQALLSQLETIDFNLIQELTQNYIFSTKNAPQKLELEPVESIKFPYHAREDQTWKHARTIGEQALRAGEVAAVLVAGGQGTRLGFNRPKGIFRSTTLTQKSLFQLLAEKLLYVNRRYHTRVPWYIMTCEMNDEPTRAFFAGHNHFGLHAPDVFIFEQGMLPALDRNGHLLLDSKSHLVSCPNGHGGILQALRDRGALRDMQQRGIKYIFYFQVDNVLIKMCDPVFIGFHILQQAEMSAKVVPKRDPHENVGVIGRLNGQVQVIEYSDLSRADKEARNSDGTLKYSGGNIAIHCFDYNFLERETRRNSQLPFHVAFKQVPCLDVAGNLAVSEQPNAYKFEMFIFDALKDAQRTMVMEVAREDEFSPIKNRTGNDSPATAHRDLNRLYSRWLEQAGVKIPRNAAHEPLITVEISPLVAAEAEDLKRLTLPAEIDHDRYIDEAPKHAQNTTRVTKAVAY